MAELESEDLKKRIDAKEPEFAGLVGRMKSDEDLYFMTPYKLSDFDGNPLPKVVSTTLNDPGTFAHRAIAILSSADPQVVVESDIREASQEQSVEEFIPALEYETDAMMSNRVMGMSFPFFCEQACIRGWLAGSCLLRMGKNGELIPDRRPLDSKFVRYETGIDGLEWASYTTYRSPLRIKQEYGHDVGSDKDTEVLDIYSRKKNEVYIGGKKIKTQANPYKDENGQGYVPLVIQPIPAGSMLSGPDMKVHQGESIFSLDRDLYPKMNEMASVLENLTMASFFSARQYASDAGEKAEAAAIPPWGLGVVISVEKQGGYSLIPVADIRNATRLLYSIYENRIQRGSLPNIDYGNLTFPLSAVAISRLTESKDMIFVPRLQGLAMFYQQWDKMAIRQYIQLGKNLKMGEEGTRKVFPAAGLKGEYSIKRKYYALNPEQDIANIAQAVQIPEDLISRHTVRRTIIKMRDPDGEEDLIGMEKARKIDPVIDLTHIAEGLINRERYFDAWQVLNSIKNLIRQRAMGQAVTTAPQPQTREQPKSLMPLMEGGGGGGARGKSEEEKVGEEMEEEERIGRLAETTRVGRTQEA